MGIGMYTYGARRTSSINPSIRPSIHSSVIDTRAQTPTITITPSIDSSFFQYTVVHDTTVGFGSKPQIKT